MTFTGERTYLNKQAEPVPVVGAVSEQVSYIRRTDTGHDYTRREVIVGDVSEKADRDRIDSILDHYETELINHPEWKAPPKGLSYGDGSQAAVDRRYEEPITQQNPAWEWFYRGDPEQTSMLEWRELIPSARALYPMQRLSDAGRVFRTGVVDDRAMDIFTNTRDCVGLRSRAAIARDGTFRLASETNQDMIKAVSLGCGAAVPNIDTTVAVQEALGKRIQWECYDTDASALDFGGELAAEAGIASVDITMHHRPYVRAFSMERESVDLVDVLGLWEYLDDKQCTRLLKKSYGLLKPGGLFISSNMLLTRKQLEFNQRGVGWWPLHYRSPDELADIVAAAGIETTNTRLTTTGDGVYAVMELHKP